MRNKMLINTEKKRHFTRMAVLEKEGAKRKNIVITTQGIRIWSPIQVLTQPNRA